MFSGDYFKVGKNNISPFQTMVAYMGGSAFQTIIDNLNNFAAPRGVWSGGRPGRIFLRACAAPPILNLKFK